MKESTTTSAKIEVKGTSLIAVINSMENGKQDRIAIMLRHNINPDPLKWYILQDTLLVYRDLLKEKGEMNLFLIGKAIISNATFPPMKNLEEALQSIDVAYHMNHRIDGKIMFDPARGKTPGIGNYTLQSFDARKREAVLVCTSLYPTDYDRGIITQIVRNFRPSDSVTSSVDLDLSKETRSKGGKSCTYNIKW